MAEARQQGRVGVELDADERAALRQAHFGKARPFIERHMGFAARRVGERNLAGAMMRRNRENKARAESVAGAQDGAKVHRLGNPLRADAEIASHDRLFCADLERRAKKWNPAFAGHSRLCSTAIMIGFDRRRPVFRNLARPLKNLDHRAI